jgi:predicted small secreted protein
MNHYLNKKLLCIGAVLASMALLTACNTVADTAEGAATGARKDIQAVSNTVNQPKTHHKMQKTKTIKKTTNVPGQTTGTTTTTTKTNSSY